MEVPVRLGEASTGAEEAAPKEMDGGDAPSGESTPFEAEWDALRAENEPQEAVASAAEGGDASAELPSGASPPAVANLAAMGFDRDRVIGWLHYYRREENEDARVASAMEHLLARPELLDADGDDHGVAV